MGTASKVQISAVARLFSPGVVKELARLGRSPLFSRLIAESNLAGFIPEQSSVGQVFDQAFAYLKNKRNRHEYIYKAAITEKILLGTHSLHTASMLTEFRVGDCKADIAILNGTGSVYEIKSERDSLSRLDRQMEAYRKVFASVNVIVGENHLDGVIGTIPSDVGIMVLSDRYQISTVREGLNLPDRTNSQSIFDAIALKEAEVILRKLGLQPPDVPNTQRYRVYRGVFGELPPVSVHESMVSTLKQTRSLASLKDVLEGLPSSLYSAFLSARFKRPQQERLVCAIDTPIEEAVRWA